MIPPLLIWSAIALALYALPALVALASRRADASPGPALLDAGTALALDAAGVLLLSRFVPLRDAVWISRGLWLAVLALRARRGWRPPRVAPAALALCAACVALVALGFRRLSYQLVMWDRDWHIPLVSALRVQRAPFENVFLPRAPLRYHFLGDVAAAMIQTLSRDHLNASLALSLAHDLYLTLLATLTAGACYLAAAETWRPTGPRALARGALGLVAGLGGAWATLFASPFVLTHAPLAELQTTLDSGPLCGHSYLPFPSIAYRPHVVVASFFIAQVFFAVVIRARAPHDVEGARRCTAALLSAACALALLDEASHALLAAALFATAALVPRALARRWVLGLVVAGCFAAALPFVSAGLGASLGLGGAASHVELVPPRHLKLFEEPIPLTDREAFWRLFRRDYFPQLAAAALSLLAALWTRRRAIVSASIFYTALAALSIWAALRVEVNKSPDEGHRFVTASMILAPVVATWILTAARGAWPVRLALVGVLAASGYSGWLWRNAFIRHRFVAEHTPSERRWAGPYNPSELDCASFGGALRRGLPPIEYLEREVAYGWSGCQPTRLLGGASKWNLAVHGIRFGWAARAGYRDEGDATVPSAIVCAAGAQSFSRERVCRWALEQLRCENAGATRRCVLPPSERERFFELLD